MQSFKEIFVRKWEWACENKPAWAHALFFVITGAIILIKPAMVDEKPTDFPIRVWGMFLQLIGAYFVWVDLTKTAKGYGVERKHLQWLVRFFQRPAPVDNAIILAGSAICSFTGHAPLVTQAPILTIEERVAKLEIEIANVNVEVLEVWRTVQVHKNELNVSIERRAGEAREELRQVKEEIKDALVGNYDVLNFGAVWLVVGIVLSSVAVEITNFVHLHRQVPAFW